VELNGSPELLASRIAHRADHFMPPALLASQLATLEPLQPDEPGMVMDVAHPVAELVDQISARLRAEDAGQSLR
jgi:gluconate kinase